MSILLKRNTNPGVVPLPEELVPGEIAINTADGSLYTKNEDGEIIVLASAADLPISLGVAWEDITGKPSFELQSHTHQPSDIVGTAVIDSDPRLVDAREALPHDHMIQNVYGLQDALDSKSNTGHTHDTRYYTKTQNDNLLSNKSNNGHNHTTSEITDFTTIINNVYSSISGVQTDITELETSKQDAGDYALASHDHGHPNFLTKIGFNAALNVPLSVNPDGLSSMGITAIGFAACQSNTTGWQNTGIGNVVLLNNSTGEANTGLGSLSLQFTTTGAWNTAAGIGSLRNNTTGRENTAIGSVSMYNNTTGSNNTVIGQAALWKNTVGSNNISIGYAAEVNESNYNNCIIIGTNATAYRSGDFVLGSTSNPVVVATTVGSNGSASATPNNPLGYLEVRLNGTLVKIPYYRA